MAEVFGSIGNEQVELNNAATEATLRLLLQSSLAANKQSIESINKIALRAGVDENTVKQTNQRIGAIGQAAYNTGAAWAGLSDASGTLRKQFREVSNITETLVSGTAQASDVFKLFTRFGGPVGLVADGLVKLAQFQENQLKSYQDLTKAGVNFGGSLTDVRLAASQTFMTMQEFTSFVSRNSASINLLGATADEGMKAFKTVSKEFQTSNMARDMRSLGYTSVELNDHLVQFMALQGKAGTQNAQTVAQVQQATANYMAELDGLTKLTGANKEKLEQEQKKAEMNAAFQAKLASLGPLEQAKLKAAYDKAAASGIKGATDLVMSTALGLVPVTKESQLLSGVMPEVAASMSNMTNVAMQSGTSMRDVNKSFSTAVDGVALRTKGMEQQIGAMAMSGSAVGQVLNSGLMLEVNMRKKGIESGEDYMAAQEKITAEQEEQIKSQATAAAETKLSFDKLGLSIMEKLMPAVAAMLSVMNPLIQGLVAAVEWIAKTPVALGILLGVVGALTVAFVKNRIAQVKEAAIRATRGTDANPMVVRDVSSKGGLELPEKGTKGKGGKLLKGLKGGVGGIIGGLALDYAGEKLKESGNEKAGAGVDVAGSALSGASTGAMLGSFVPGIGTAIGGALGGLAGGAYGLYQNWDTMFGGTGKEVPKPKPEATKVEELPMPEQVKAMATQMPGITSPFESLTKQLEKLNTQTTEMVRYLKETSEQIRRNVDATKSLNGNLFPTP